jgi:hypothetical protein
MSRTTNRSHVAGVVLAVLLPIAVPAAGDRLPVVLQMDPATSTVNTLTVELSASYSFFTRRDTDQATATGWMGTGLTAAFNHFSHAARISAIEFIGGDLSMSDMSFQLNFLVGSVYASGTGIGGSVDTPGQPGPVTGGVFPTEWHEVILDRGTFTAYGTGALEELVPPIDMDLSAEPIATTTVADGTVAMDLATLNGRQATYNVVLEMPVDFDQPVIDDPTSAISASISGQGLFRASGSFVRTVPILGDLNGDDAVGADDIDELYGHVGLHEPEFDVNGDWAVNTDDVGSLVRDVLASEYGDADLDGDVDWRDYLTLKRSITQPPAAPGWAEGNFDGQPGVGWGDYALARDGFGFPGAAPATDGAAVPEPASMAVMSLAALGLLIGRRRKG